MSLRLAGVLGSPIDHSKSPLIHNHWIKINNIKGLYVPLNVQPQDFQSFIHMAPRLGFAGFNVTIPHKEAAASLCVELSETARRAGSVNTIRFGQDGQALGDSTDGYGFLENLREKAGWSPAGKTVAMFGAGGAARAVVAALIDGGAGALRLTNRSHERALELAAQIGRNVECWDWEKTALAQDAGGFLDGADLIVNATSLGMDGGPEWRWNMPQLNSDVVATDLIYAPLITPFLKAAAAQGAVTVDGLGMLLHQAVPGFEQWFGARPAVDATLREIVLQGEGALP